MREKIIVASVLLASFVNVNAAEHAKVDQQSKYALTAKVGTLGAGLDLTYKINPKFNARINLNKASADYNEVEDGVTYTGDLDLFTVGALVDYHPFQNNFRMSAGLYKNNNEINASSTDADEAEIGGTVYDIEGTLNSSISFKSIAPYIGIGWGNAVKRPNRWRISFDAGVLFQGKPEGKLSIGDETTVRNSETGQLEDIPDFEAELAQEEDNLNAELKDFKAYPAISLGVSYNF